MTDKKNQATEKSIEFRSQANERSRGLIGELLGMVLENKKWWMIPILVMILVLAMVVVFGSSAAAPFIYTLF